MTTIGTTSRPAYVYDAQTDTWIPVGVGPHKHDEYIEKTVITAKGDILVGTASDAVAKLGVGPEGSVLIVDPTSATGLAWGEAGGSISVSTTSPEDPSEGDLWFNSANATTYIYYDSFWVELSEAKLGPTGLPGVVIQDGEPLNTDVIWLDTDEESLAPVPAGGTSGQILQKTSNENYETAWVNPPSGNAIINGAFEINQRNFTSTTGSSVFTFDRWATRAVDGTSTFTAEEFALGSAPMAGYESKNYIRLVSTGQSGTDARTAITQAIESVRTFAGQTVTLSFWARASSGTPSLAAYFAQNFGSGSPDTPVDIDGQKVSLTTSWNRYSLTFNIPSIAGKTIGPHSDRLGLFLLTSAGSIWDSQTNSLGIQSTAIDIWGVQVEAGSTATEFRRNANSLQGELAACQRYYQRFTSSSVSADVFGYGSAISTTAVNFNGPIPTTLRLAPTAIDFAASMRVFDGAASAFTITNITLSSAPGPQTLSFTASVSSGLTQFRNYRLIAQDGQFGFVGFSAEM